MSQNSDPDGSLGKHGPVMGNEAHAASPFTGRQAILFDLDGTLIRSSLVHEEAFRVVLLDYGIAGFDYAEFAGRRTREVFEEVFRQAGRTGESAPIDVASQRKQALARTMLAAKIELVQGAREFITAAVERGLRLAVATSASRASAMAALVQSGLRNYFEVVVTGDEVLRAKPAPDVWLEALRQLDIPASSAVAIEDSQNGVVSARKAGLDVILVLDRGLGETSPQDSQPLSATFSQMATLL
jgi:HAD superfamily hydrolase (TIGR01509 family)